MSRKPFVISSASVNPSTSQYSLAQSSAACHPRKPRPATIAPSHLLCLPSLIREARCKKTGFAAESHSLGPPGLGSVASCNLVQCMGEEQDCSRDPILPKPIAGCKGGCQRIYENNIAETLQGMVRCFIAATRRHSLGSQEHLGVDLVIVLQFLRVGVSV